MQPLLGIIIWPMSIQKQPCTAACKQKCATQCMQISRNPNPHAPSRPRSIAEQPQEYHPRHQHQPVDSTIRNAPHQPSPQPPATSHGTGTSHHPSHQPWHRHHKSAPDTTHRIQPTAPPPAIDPATSRWGRHRHRKTPLMQPNS